MLRRAAPLVLLVALLVASVARAAPADDARALTTLGRHDVYATSALGTLAGVVEERLAAKAAQLRARGEDVKLAVVGPLRGEDPFRYAQDLRRRLGYGGTLVLTTPDGPVGAAGRRRAESLRGAFAAARVDDLRGPAQRVIAASELALPPDDEGGSWREVVVLIGLTLVGGAWAISWGLRREQRRARLRGAEARARLRVGLDALRARIDLVGDHADLPAHGRDLLAQAQDRAADALRRGQAGMEGEGVDDALRDVHDAFRLVELAGALVGEDVPADDLFAGLCAVDPAHGAARTAAPVAGADAPVCAACAGRAAAGVELVPRAVPVEGRPVPFAEAGVPCPAGSREGTPKGP